MVGSQACRLSKKALVPTGAARRYLHSAARLVSAAQISWSLTKGPSGSQVQLKRISEIAHSRRRRMSSEAGRQLDREATATPAKNPLSEPYSVSPRG
jgi:hypothetical protein